MPELTRFGFIAKRPGYRHRIHRAVLDTGRLATWAVGVEGVGDATAAVADLSGRGVQRVELCVGFTQEEGAPLQQGSDLSIGFMLHGPATEARLRELFAPPSGH
jgi:hypothetical protein